MDWPHDPDGEQGSEGRRNYGHAILAKKVDEEEDFPFTAGEYVEEYGDHPIRIDDERVVSVAAVFEPIDDDVSFETFPELHTRVGDALRAQGYWPYHLDHA
jgi:hypothetical protein